MLSEEEIMEKVQWAIDVNHITRSINGDNTSINVNALKGLLDLYNKEKEKNKELEYSLKNNVVTKYCIRHKADDYEGKGYIEIAGAMRELLEERN